MIKFYNVQYEGLSPWNDAEICGLRLLLSILYNFHVVCRQSLSEKCDFCWFEIYNSLLISSQRKNTDYFNAR